jgi:hypothetical protein
MFSKWIAGGMLLVLLGLGAVLRADVTGSIDGIVKDSSGAVAVNVEAGYRLVSTNLPWNQKASRSLWLMSSGFR